MQQHPTAPSTIRGAQIILPAALFILAFFAARGLLELPDLSPALRIFAALLPVAPFAWMLWSIIRRVRDFDELEQRIQLEALAVAFPLTLILLMTLGLLEIAIRLPAEDLSYRHVWAILPAFYLVGLKAARKRYQ